MRNVLALVMAGGKGSRLDPLTTHRAKPAVPFGGAYRIIDFTLSNCVNSGIRRMLLLTQYKAASLDRHINLGWRLFNRDFDEFIDILPPQQRVGEEWYQGTADAVYQNIYSIEKARPDHVVILSGDHIYKMDYSELVKDHIDSGADITIGCIPVTLREATEFGVMGVNNARRVIQFDEKPAKPQCMPDDPTRALASMGIYVFRTEFLFEELCRDAADPNSSHDFGKNIIPRVINTHKVQAFPFQTEATGDQKYWRDVGTIDAYYEANMDLISAQPQFDLGDPTWPIRTHTPALPPPRFLSDQLEDDPAREMTGCAVDSMVCVGSVINGAIVRRSVLSSKVSVERGATVDDSILFDGVTVGRNARLRRVIVDKDVSIPAGTSIGFDLAIDRERGFEVSEAGIVVVPRDATFD